MRSFFVSCNPPRSTAQQGTRAGIVNGKARVFKSAKSRQIAANWVALLKPHAPETPATGAVALAIAITFPHLKSAPKAERGRFWVKHTRKPDCDNLAKAIKDAMTTCLFWLDDSQVYALSVVKGRGQNPGIQVEITESNER